MRTKFFIALLPMLLVSGCAGKMDAQRGLSEEWRLRSLEENFLNFKEGQREQEENANAQQRKVTDRVKALEEAVVQLQEQAGAVPLRRPVPVAAPAHVVIPTAPPAHAPVASSHASARPASRPIKQAPAPATVPQAAMQSDALAPSEGVLGSTDGDGEKPWAVVPGTQESKERTLAEPQSAPAPAFNSSSAPHSARAAGLTGTALYNEGMTQVRAEHPEAGRALLEQYLAAEPNSSLAPNALYWIGESYFNEKNYPQAILSFKNVTRRFPKHHKAAAALLKIGMAYEQLGEKDNATLYLRALLQEHPKSEPAPIARKKLAELGG